MCVCVCVSVCVCVCECVCVCFALTGYQVLAPAAYYDQNGALVMGPGAGRSGHGGGGSGQVRLVQTPLLINPAAAQAGKDLRAALRAACLFPLCSQEPH